MKHYKIMKEYKIFDIIFDPSQDIGMTAISFVDAPAIGCNFVYQTKQNNERYSPGQILMASTEKHLVISPILIPNQLILRSNEYGEKFYLRWSKEVIEQVANFYIMNQFNNNFTLQHSWFEGNDDRNYKDTFLKDVYMERMWIIEDAENDDAHKLYGYHLPVGTLMAKIKVHNRKLWQQIKSGEVKGLSIEALIPHQENGKITFKKTDNSMNKSQIKNLFDKFLVWYSEVSEEAKELADVAATDETESGEVALRYYTSDSDYIEIAADGSARAEPEPEEAPIAEAADDEEKKDDEEKTEEPSAEETPEEEPKEDDKEKKEEQEEIQPALNLVEIEIAGETYNVPQAVYEYIKGLEEAAGMAENFQKELAKMQSRMPSVKPVGTVVKEEDSKKDAVSFSCADLIASMNKKLS